jgi:hypothetical protein
MAEHPVGQIVTFFEAQCPTCGGLPHGLAAISVKRIWDGSSWVLLNSYEGGQLAAKIARELA